ncbi:MAG: XrtA/PEP-CTERM system-associated ATPase [Nitrospirota bacterium]
MYEAFFNFRTKPFELVPNPDFLFVSKAHKRAMTYLDYGIKEKAGFILLTGEVGSGKTTLLRDLLKKLHGRVTVSKVFNTKVNSEQLIAMINDDFGLPIRGKDKVQLLKDLYDFLIGQYAKGYHSVLIIDEAQNLNAELLEEVRMLSNLETDNAKLLQIILAGQPELRKTLSLPELQQFRQRINISCHVYPLTRPEMEEYILHRLEVAGNKDAVHFPEATLDSIYQFSRGVPRLINIICDFLLISAFVEETKELSAEMVAEVIGDLEMENRYWAFETSIKEVMDGNGQRAFGEEERKYYDEIKGLLSSMNLRLDALEKGASRLGPGVPIDTGKRLDLFEKFMKEHIRKTESSLAALRSTIEEYEKRLPYGGPDAKESKRTKKSLLRRIFMLPERRVRSV